MARTAKRQLEGRHLLFGEYLQSWTTQNVHYESFEDELNIDGGKHVLAMFLNKELNYFEWIIKQLLNSAFVSYYEDVFGITVLLKSNYQSHLVQDFKTLL